MKKCKICSVTKEFINFEKGRNSCRDCRNLHRKKLKTRSGVGLREYSLKKLYNLSLDDYFRLSNNQNNCCAICKTLPKSRWGYQLVVDHCHKSDKIRGLLCDNCNKGLGQFKDSIVLLQQAAAYLKKLV